MVRIRLSFLIATVILTVFFFLTFQEYGFSQESLSLGCCKTVVGTPTCEGCGDGGLKCAMDASLCSETSRFSLGQVCFESSLAGQAECQDPQSASGCCITSQDKCEDGVNFDKCTGQHWFEDASCSDVPQCSTATSNYTDRIIIVVAIIIVIVLLIIFRRRKPGA